MDNNATLVRNKVVTNAQGYSPSFAWTRMFFVFLIAIGHISTLPLGVMAPEALVMFGYNPSWLGVNTLFFMAGYMALRSLSRGKKPLDFLTNRLGNTLPTVALYVLLTIFVVFPVFGINPTEIKSLPKHLAVYAFDVISLSDPGRMLKGLFDDAKYECVIQGAIWTFRWGAIAYIATAIGWKVGLLKSKTVLYTLTIATLCAYIVLMGLKVGADLTLPASIYTALRLGWIFLAGMSMFALGDKVRRHWAICVILVLFTAIAYLVLKWTPFIEILATLSWCYVAFMMFTSTVKLPKIMQNTPDLSLGIYIFHWPIAQIMLVLVPAALSLSLCVIALPITISLSYAVFWINKHYLSAFLEALSNEPSKITTKGKTL